MRERSKKQQSEKHAGCAHTDLVSPEIHSILIFFSKERNLKRQRDFFVKTQKKVIININNIQFITFLLLTEFVIHFSV